MAVLNPWRTNLGNFLLAKQRHDVLRRAADSARDIRKSHKVTKERHSPAVPWLEKEILGSRAGKHLDFGSETSAKLGTSRTRGNVVNEQIGIQHQECGFSHDFPTMKKHGTFTKKHGEG